MPAIVRGQSCDAVERLDGAMPEAIRIAQAYADAYHARFPTESMEPRYVIDVSRLDGHVALRAQVADVAGVWVGREDGDAVIPLAEIFFPGGPVWSRYGIAEYFIDGLPGAPALLFNCIDMNGILPMVPDEADDPVDILDPNPDCSRVAQVSVTDPDVRKFEGQFAPTPGRASLVTSGVEGAWRQDQWLVIRVGFIEFEGDRQRTVYGLYFTLPEIHAIRRIIISPFPSRRLVARHVLSFRPDMPRELLSCIPIETTPPSFFEYQWMSLGLNDQGP